ncbi:MAG: hypothetical protein M3O36_16025, partial [Myxococcota bacterium]|nr:hypothetical protein [Myxococcota bacterium]
GVLHAPFARSLLMRAGGCPMGGVRMTAAEMEAGRHRAAQIERGGTPAPARPALGFVLDKTTVADVRGWAKSHRISCEEPHPGLVVCSHVPAAFLGLSSAEAPVDDLALGFNQRDVLVNATTFRSRLTPDAAATAARQIASGLSSALGPAETTAGAFEAAHIAQEPAASVAVVSYRYSDYIASVSAMNMPGGATLREQYMSAND